jgi:hypothetical protein
MLLKPLLVSITDVLSRPQPREAVLGTK